VGAYQADAVNQAPRRLAALFLIAVAGVFVALGLVVGAVAGVPGAVTYAAAVVVLTAFGAQRVRSRVRAAGARAAGRTCTCCSGTVHDPVQVLR
jgi:hypothetical protein